MYRLVGCNVLIFAVTVGAAACASTLNQTYQRLDHVPDGKAVVYTYRSNPLLGAAFSMEVNANSTPVNSIYAGTYYPYITASGMVEFSAKTESTETLSGILKPGATYYLKLGIRPGIFIGRPLLIFVPEAEAEQEIVTCKLLREPGQ